MSKTTSLLRDPSAVRLIVEGLNKLTKERLEIDVKIVDLAYFAKEHNGSFSILDQLQVADFKETWTQAISKSRDIASGDISTHLTVFVDVKIGVVERITTMAKCQSAIKSLTAFSQEESPLEGNPLKGIDAVAKTFGEIWYAVQTESLIIVEVLKKVTEENLKKTIQTLTEELVPVKRACGEIETAVGKYATATPP
ncbi:hypothetical protein BDZ94DRAFT_1304695 [Collybia nuda]|uniref:Uncharacterized protein n=1 Tax=Collybia nuda TaxID=64659 RepID=A0A9P5YIX4_9AGAR|nr:hypothetical protein BDZ94DRAFT_1304695 [Collybia nuda]